MKTFRVLALLCLASGLRAAPSLMVPDITFPGLYQGSNSLYSQVYPQGSGQPFATTVLGLTYQTLFPSQSTWLLPAPGGGTTAVSSQRLQQATLRVGGLHFFGHALIDMQFPLDSPSVNLGREFSASYFMETGVQWFPWALGANSLRPFVSTGLLRRTLTLSDSQDPGANPGTVSQTVFPLGLGFAFLSSGGGLLDFEVQRSFNDSPSLPLGVAAQDLARPSPAYATSLLDLSGYRVSVGLEASWSMQALLGQAGQTQQLLKLASLEQQGRLSGPTLEAGLSMRLYHNDSDYFDVRRPYLSQAYQEPFFFHGGVGYYFFSWDAELRLASRAIAGSARAYGADLKASQQGLFAEALKFFDPHFYGFVPFVGAGAGHEDLDLSDSGGGASYHLTKSVWVPDLVFGWELRTDPSQSWLIRTNFRWIPKEQVSILPGVNYDFGGLEYDLFQLVVFPARLLGN